MGVATISKGICCGKSSDPEIQGPKCIGGSGDPVPLGSLDPLEIRLCFVD